MRNAKLKFVALGLVLYAACKDSSAPQKPPIVDLGSAHSAPANTVISPDVVIKVQDGAGNPRAGVSVQFSIAQGGGSLTGSSSATTDANGQATAPVWRLGKSANGNEGQILRAKAGNDSLYVKATAATNFNIKVRFFDDQNMTAAQKLLFTQAAERIQGIIIGDMDPVALSNTDISGCLGKPANSTAITETIDDLLVYATVKTGDGPGNVLASAGPCFVRTSDNTPIIGHMEFDIADFPNLAGPGGSLVDVITHEMLHVVGVGSLWNCSSSACRGFVDSAGTTNPMYNAPAARLGCVAVGGTTSCASKVPLENCVGHPECAVDPLDPSHGAGTRDVHWRESTFGTELMTGFLNNGSTNPLSAITIGALTDLGYTVNAADTDAYTIAVGSSPSVALRAPAPVLPTMKANWEQLEQRPLYSIDRAGRVRLIRKGQVPQPRP